MSRRAQENLVAGVLLAGFVGIIVMSLDYSPRSRLVPLPMAILGVLLVTIQLIWQNVRSIDELQVDALEFLTGNARTKGLEPTEVQSAVEPKGRTSSATKNLIAFGMVALLLAAFLLLGPVPAIFIFTAGYLILTGQSSWARALVYAAVFAIIIVVVFGYILKIPLDRSILLPGIGQHIGL
jgi:hypothetical protein